MACYEPIEQVMEVMASFRRRWEEQSRDERGSNLIAAEIWPQVHFHALEFRPMGTNCLRIMCRKQGTMRCSRCKIARYCSIQCQKQYVDRVLVNVVYADEVLS